MCSNRALLEPAFARRHFGCLPPKSPPVRGKFLLIGCCTAGQGHATSIAGAANTWFAHRQVETTYECGSQPGRRVAPADRQNRVCRSCAQGVPVMQRGRRQSRPPLSGRPEHTVVDRLADAPDCRFVLAELERRSADTRLLLAFQREIQRPRISTVPCLRYARKEDSEARRAPPPQRVPVAMSARDACERVAQHPDRNDRQSFRCNTAPQRSSQKTSVSASLGSGRAWP